MNKDTLQIIIAIVGSNALFTVVILWSVNQQIKGLKELMAVHVKRLEDKMAYMKFN